MKAFTLVAPGRVVPGVEIGEAEQCVFLRSAANDGRVLVMPVRAGSVLAGGRLMETPGDGALVLIADHGGINGSWALRGAHSDERWDAMAATEAIAHPLDRTLARERVRWRYPDRAPLGWCELASGQRDPARAGFGGEGRVALGILVEGAAVEIRRVGTLAGGPAVIRVACRDGALEVDDPRARALERAAARARAAVGERRWAR